MAKRFSAKSGDVFGYLKVIKETSNEYEDSCPYFLCTCKKGHLVTISLYRLRTVVRTGASCKWCLDPELCKLGYPEIGDRYGHWVVLSQLIRKKRVLKLFYCKCDCGERRVYTKRQLLATPHCSRDNLDIEDPLY